MATLRHFRNVAGDLVDTGVALYFPRPASFTGESVLELHGHGGPVVVSMLVDAIVEWGARLAEPGEFSRRAFLNSKLDLAQAEAVIDLIGSGTARAAQAALRSLTGEFSRAVNALAEQILALRMYVEAAIDFPEEEIDFLSDEALSQRIDQCGEAFDALLSAAQQGRVLRDGFQVVIVGRPNAGKSSLLNLLSGQEAAIVTEVAGTTRDILREQIEAEGIRRAREALASADGVLWIQDVTDAQQVLREELPPGVHVTVVHNKIDLTGDAPGIRGGEVWLSAATGEGIAALRQRIRELAGYEGGGTFTARRRHVRALEAAAEHFATGRQALVDNRAGELLAEELRLSQQALGEITGEVSADELLGRIFSEFCIGK